MISKILKALVLVVVFILGYLSSSLTQEKVVQKHQVVEKHQEIPKEKVVQKTILQKIKEKKQLDVVILNSPTVYYVGAHEKLGFEYQLLSEYAKDLGVDLNLTIVHTIDEALQKSRDGVGDITSSALTLTPARDKEFKFGPRYYSVQEQLICHQSMHKKGTFPKDKEDMVGLNIVVGENTSYETTMQELQTEIPDLNFTITSDYSTDILLEMTYNKKIDCTVVDSNIFLINQRYYPGLVRAITLSERKNLAWILREGDDSLNKNLHDWLNRFERSGKMAELRDFNYSFLGLFDYYDTAVFHKRLKKRLPRYIKYFKAAEKKYGIPWMLLAAQSYQESHWNPKAKSYTGVRGMMMITRTTAKQLGVKNRLDPKQSIFGGAKYLKKLEKRFPKEIEGKENRLFFTLAAYNVGLAHVRDAQKLAIKLNKDPNSWTEIKKVLPLLAQKKYNKHLKHGYARGAEPVKYVNSIQNYLSIIMNKYKD